MNGTIPPETHIGKIHLAVTNLDRSVKFYHNAVGLTELSRADGRVWMGAPNPSRPDEPQPFLLLSEQPGGKHVRGVSGLYHVALRVPDRRALAWAITRLTEYEDLLQGVADHGVSEAVYLSDPDGNGIEIYRDRPREEWPHDAGGELEMTTDPLDLDAVMATLGKQPNAPTASQVEIGHVHLHVANLQKAVDFYQGVLGFDLVQRYGPSAAFLSAGGYHHHVGINTWAGEGAPPPPADALGLRWYSIELPNQEALDAELERVKQANLQVEERVEGSLVRDPAGNGIILEARA